MFDSSGPGGVSTVLGGARSGGARAGSAAPRAEDVLMELEDVRERFVGLARRAADADRWTGAQRAIVLGTLDRLAALVPAVRAPVLAAHQAAAAAAGAERELADTRARQTGSSRWQVATQVRTAETLTRLPDVRTAMAEGRVREGHADVLARTLAEAPAQVAQALSTAEGQAAVVDLAQGVDSREFGRGLAAWVAAQDPAHHEDRREAHRRTRFLTLTHAAEGTFLRGRLDPLAGARLQRALDATGHRPDEDRTPEQARADALTALAGGSVRHGVGGGDAAAASGGDAMQTASCGEDDMPVEGGDADGAAGPRGVGAPGVGGAGSGAHVSLLVPAETWALVRSQQAQRRAVGPRAQGRRSEGVPLMPPTVPSAVTDAGVPLSATELAAALCDCAMARVVMDAAGLPLDVGRTRRAFTPAQRYAVIARDRVCAWNGCSVPPAYGQLHHIAWWHRDGGATDLDNALLLCGFHHHEVHRLDLDVERVERAEPGVLSTLGSPTGGEGRRYVFRGRGGRAYNAPGAVPAGGARVEAVPP